MYANDNADQRACNRFILTSTMTEHIFFPELLCGFIFNAIPPSSSLSNQWSCLGIIIRKVKRSSRVWHRKMFVDQSLKHSSVETKQKMKIRQ